MNAINKIADWILAKSYRYWIAQWVMYTIVFFCACLTVAVFFGMLTK